MTGCWGKDKDTGTGMGTQGAVSLPSGPLTQRLLLRGWASVCPLVGCGELQNLFDLLTVGTENRVVSVASTTLSGSIMRSTLRGLPLLPFTTPVVTTDPSAAAVAIAAAASDS